MSSIKKSDPKEEAICSDTGGVQPMSIGGRMIYERERCLGMTEGERAWRAQWLKDQILAPEEPVVPEGWYKERFNPIRRFYRAPMDKFEALLSKRMSFVAAKTIRHMIANVTMGLLFIYCSHYYLKYNHGDWTRKKGARVFYNRPVQYPGDPGYPTYEIPEKEFFADHGFKNSKLHK